MHGSLLIDKSHEAGPARRGKAGSSNALVACTTGAPVTVGVPVRGNIGDIAQSG
jgi:hypothetical protein